jgi:hypothetical protein
MTNAKLTQNVLKWIEETDRASLTGLIIANLLPLFLCFVFGWHITSLVMFYWVENLIIGLYAIARILCASQPFDPQPPFAATIFVASFFTVHYFGVCLGHGVFLLVISTMDFAGGPRLPFSPFDENVFVQFWQLLPPGGLLSVLALFISHGVSFVRNYLWGGEYTQTTPPKEMARPYARIVLLHVSIIFGMFLVMTLGSPLFLVMLFVVLKTALDAVIHCYSHRKKTSPAEAVVH